MKIRSGHGYPLGIPPLSVNQLIPRTVQERLVAASKRLGSLYGRGRVVSRTRQGWHAPPLANSKWGVWLDLIPSTPPSHSLSLLSITANAPLRRPLAPSPSHHELPRRGWWLPSLAGLAVNLLLISAIRWHGAAANDDYLASWKKSLHHLSSYILSILPVSFVRFFGHRMVEIK